MSGPQYPPGPAPGSNAIGSFVIGVSPIGDIRTFDFWRTVISQYGNSDRLTGILAAFADCVDQTQNLAELFDNIFNIDTARGYGLDVWGARLGIGRIVRVQPEAPFGFGEAGLSVAGFGQGSFNAGQALTENFDLADDAYRTLLLAKALANICDSSIYALNRLLQLTFPGRGNCYVTDGDAPGLPDAPFGFNESDTALGFNQGPFFVPDDLSAFFFGFGESPSWKSFDEAPFYDDAPARPRRMTYTFEFPLSPLDLAIVEGSGVLPRPTGVSVSVVQRF